MRVTNQVLPVEKHFIETKVEAATVDLQPLHDKHKEIDAKLNKVIEVHNRLAQGAVNELEMQRRALVGLKVQRDVDRKRRLQLLKRLKKHRDQVKKSSLQMKLAVGASLLLSIITLILK